MIAARTVLSLQTIVSRETDPFDPVVITVGSIHGGTKHNIVPDEVHLELSVRTFKPEVRTRVLGAIERIAKAEALAGAATREPAISVTQVAKATYNDVPLTNRLVEVLGAALGRDRLVEEPPTTVSEDFSEFHLAGIPATMLWIGAVEPATYAKAQGEWHAACGTSLGAVGP